MVATSPRERLTKLADLASRTDVPASELTTEVADLLADWPANYPPSMREPFEALLEKSLQELDSDARKRLAERFVTSTGMPLTVLNALVLDASPEVQNAVLARNAAVTMPDVHPPEIDEKALLKAICEPAGDVVPSISLHFCIPRDIAAAAVADASAFGLAVLCQGTNCRRATFSAVAVLCRPQATHEETFSRLATYDRVSKQEAGARALFQSWRAQISGRPQNSEIGVEAAEGTAS